MTILDDQISPLLLTSEKKVFGDFIAFTTWENTTGTPISFFSTKWQVPPPPKAHDNQTIFLFNGLQNEAPPAKRRYILQPVLQWGKSDSGGGNYWSIASFFAMIDDDKKLLGTSTDPIRVEPGETLTGIIEITGKSLLNGENVYHYRCSFQGIDGTVLHANCLKELKWCLETLEVFKLGEPPRCSDYPNTDSIIFSEITIQTNEIKPPIEWQSRGKSECGQAIVADSGDVLIRFR